MEANTCPLCYETTTDSVVTGCGHTFCSRCLGRWTATNSTCPMCRESLPIAAGRPAPVTTEEASVVAAPTPAANTLRDRIEREHAERAEQHRRVVETERRLDNYRASVWTPSGRPFESLPVVSLSQMRQVLQENQRALAVACASASS